MNKRRKQAKQTCYGISVKIKTNIDSDIDIEDNDVGTSKGPKSRIARAKKQLSNIYPKLISNANKQKYIDITSRVNHHDQHVKKSNISHIMLLVILSTTSFPFMFNQNFCNCDKRSNNNNNSPNHALSSSSMALDAKQNTNESVNLPKKLQSKLLVTQSYQPKPSTASSLSSIVKAHQPTIKPASKNSNPIPRSQKKDRSNLLASLAENIERQHYKLNNPIKSFVQHQQRPSKFDNGQDNIIEDMPNKSIDQLSPELLLSNKFSQSLLASKRLSEKRQEHKQHQRYNQPEDLKMRQILMLHEHAAANSVASKHNNLGSPPSKNENDLGKTYKNINDFGKLASLWSNSFVPFIHKGFISNTDSTASASKPIISQLVPRPNQVVKQVMSFLLPANDNADHEVEQASKSIKGYEQKQLPSFSNSTIKSLYSLSHPFSARANSGVVKSGDQVDSASRSPISLRELGKKISSQLIKTFSSSTDAPQALAVLARPFNLGFNDKQRLKFTSTTPASSSPSAPSNDQQHPVDDLMMADDSSPTRASFVAQPQSSRLSKSKHQKTLKLDGSVGHSTTPSLKQNQSIFSSWLNNGANSMAHGYIQDSFRDLLTLSQLPILSGAPASTAPSDLEPGGKQWLANKQVVQQTRGNRSLALDDLLRYAYIFGSGVRRKRDPLKVLGPTDAMTLVNQRHTSIFNRKNAGPTTAASFQLVKPHSTSSAVQIADNNNHETNRQFMSLRNRLSSVLGANKNAKPRGVMWDMATDPSLAVTVFHMLERASVALPLGFLLMPMVHMIRNPLNGFNLRGILPARASHRSVDYEELAKQLDMMDKILSRALRQTHREASIVGK